MPTYKVRFVADFEVTVDADDHAEALVEAFDWVSYDGPDEYLKVAGIRPEED